MLVAQDRVWVEIYRRGQGLPERLGEGADVLSLDSLGFVMSGEALSV